jgi:hypothetical protein
MTIRSNLLKSIKGNKSCAIIGNAISKTDLSKQINESYVLRCNNFELTPKTGIRTDLNISSLYNNCEKKMNYPILGVLPISDNLYQKYTEHKKMHLNWLIHSNRLISNGNIVWTYGDDDRYSEVFKFLAEEINAFPTTGLMGIATMRWLGFTKIIISGFTFLKGKTIAAHHNPDAEIAIVNKWIRTDKIEYIIDDLTKEILNKFAYMDKIV